MFNDTVVNWPSRYQTYQGDVVPFRRIVPDTEIMPLAAPPAAGVKLTLMGALSPRFRDEWQGQSGQR